MILVGGFMVASGGAYAPAYGAHKGCYDNRPYQNQRREAASTSGPARMTAVVRRSASGSNRVLTESPCSRRVTRRVLADVVLSGCRAPGAPRCTSSTRSRHVAHVAQRAGQVVRAAERVGVPLTMKRVDPFWRTAHLHGAYALGEGRRHRSETAQSTRTMRCWARRTAGLHCVHSRSDPAGSDVGAPGWGADSRCPRRRDIGWKSHR